MSLVIHGWRRHGAVGIAILLLEFHDEILIDLSAIKGLGENSGELSIFLIIAVRFEYNLLIKDNK